MMETENQGRYALYTWKGREAPRIKWRSPCLRSLCAFASELPWALDWQILDLGQRHRPVMASSPVRIKDARGLVG